jgi:hypothetical protein
MVLVMVIDAQLDFGFSVHDVFEIASGGWTERLLSSIGLSCL